MPDRQIGIFAKYWSPGRVKTRLASTIGNDLAAEVARALLATLLGRLAAFNAHKVLGFTPYERRRDFLELAPSWTLQPQCEGDLGARMADYFAKALQGGTPKVLLLGADCPTVPLSHIEAAFAALDSFDTVLGPASDGGYYLMAVRDRVPPLLDHGRWGDETVLSRTLELARRRGVSVGLVQPWDDVDDLSDLRRLRQWLRAAADAGEAWQLLRESIDRALAEAGDGK